MEGGADAFLFSAALVFFTSDAEGSVRCFKDEDCSGVTTEELGGIISSGMTDAVALAVSSGATVAVCLVDSYGGAEELVVGA